MRDAARDLNAELLAAANDLSKGRIGRVHVATGDGVFAESDFVKELNGTGFEFFSMCVFEK